MRARRLVDVRTGAAEPCTRLLHAEISDPVLQKAVLRLAWAAARADGHLADGETVVVQAARRHWQLVDGEASSAPAPAQRHAA